MSKFEPHYIPEGLGHAPEKLHDCVAPLGLLVDHSNKILTVAAADQFDDDEEFAETVVEALVSDILSAELTLKYFDEDMVAGKFEEAVDRLRRASIQEANNSKVDEILDAIGELLGKLEEA